MPNGLTSIPRLPLPEGPNILIVPPPPMPPGPSMMGAPPGMPGNGRESPAQAPQEPPGMFVPGPWCLGADAICQWLRPIPFIGGRLTTGCRVILNILCLLVGVLLLIGIVAVLLFAFLQPG